MAAADTFPPIRGASWTVTFPILDADGDLVTGAGALDSEISKDGGTFANCSNESVELATASGMYKLTLSTTEMAADVVAIIVKSTNGKTTPIVAYPVAAGFDEIDSAITVIDTEMGQTHSETTAIQADAVIIKSDTTKIDLATTAIESELIVVHSETTALQGQATTIASDTLAIEADTTVIKSDTTKIDLATTAIESELIVVHSETTAIQGQATTIASDTLAIEAGVVVIDDLLDTEIPAITSNLVIIASDTLAIEAEVTQVHSETTALQAQATTIASDIVLIDAAVVMARGTSDSGTTLTMVDAARTEGDTDYWVGNRIQFTSGTIAGQVREITGFNFTTNTITFSPATTQAVATQTYNILQGISASGMSAAQASQLLATQAEVTVVHSETTAIQADAVIIKSDTTVIEAAGGALTAAQASDLVAIESELIVIHSETTALQLQATTIASDLIVIDDEIAQVHSETTALQAQATTIASDTLAIEAQVILVHSETTALQAQATTIASDTLAIEADVRIVDYMGPRGPGIYLNDGAANTNTAFGTDGTISTPVSTIAAAKTLADGQSIDRIYLVNDSAITLAATFQDYEFVGIGEVRGNVVNLGAQILTGSAFYNLTLEGDGGSSAGRIYAESCALQDPGAGATTLNIFAFQCGIVDDITINTSADNVFDQCYSLVAGSGTPILRASGAAGTVSMRHYSGGIELATLSASHNVSVETDGQVIFNADCNVNANVSLRGNMTITDNTAGMNNLTVEAALNRTALGAAVAANATLVAIASDTLAIEAEVTVVHSETTALQAQATTIASDTLAIEAEVTVVHSETTALQVQATTIASDLIVIDDEIAQVHSETTALQAQATTIASDTLAIEAKTVSMTFSKALELDVNTKSINDAEVIGDGNAVAWDGI